MKTIWSRTTGCVAGTMLALACGSALANVVIYTDGGHPATVENENTRVVMLDAPDTVQDRLFGTLPEDPVAAEQAARDVLASPEWKENERVLAEAYREVIAAWQLGLSRYPAVVFDGQYVVYGTASESEARARYDHWQETQ